MKSKKNLVLIGMMGSGKSTIGSLLAKKLNFQFFDIDKIIETENKMKIVQIFEKKGESFFRKLEEKTSLKYLNVPNSVISLGGGGFINENIRKEATMQSKTFWLKWDANTLIRRIKLSTKRPLAMSLKNSELKELMIKRSKIYAKTKFGINCEKLTKIEIVKKIINLYEKN
ncbi:shikimate kinase [Candidatus Pelagibacter sp.]|nr:shikimate kinase [Candidatus Pelagibacter sp.]